MVLDTALCNQALASIAHSILISDIDSEQTKEANACRLEYPGVLERVFAEFPWPKHSKTGALALLAVNPREDEFDYAYRYPAGCAFFRGILPSGAVALADVVGGGVPYRYGRDAGGVIIFSDAAEAVGEWTEINEDPSKWSAHLRRATAYLLGSEIAVAVTGGDPLELGEKALKKYAYWMTRAKSIALNEEQRPINTDSAFLRARRSRSGT